MRGKRQGQQRNKEVAGKSGQRQVCFGSRRVGWMMQRSTPGIKKQKARDAEERRSMIRDQEPGLTWGWKSLTLYFICFGWASEQWFRSSLHACTVLPLCWLIPPTYKTHNIENNECKCQEIFPCSQQPKKEFVYATYERAVTHSFNDGMIPLGSLLLANIENIFLQFIFPVWFIPHIHLEIHA